MTLVRVETWKKKKGDLSEDLIVLFMEFKIDLGLDIRGSEYVYFSKVVKSIKGNLVFRPRIDKFSLNQEWFGYKI